MAQFKLKLAGQTVAVSSLFESTRDYCLDYLTDDQAAFSLAVTQEDLALEQRYLDAEADREGLRRRVFAMPFLERNFLQRQIAAELSKRDILLLHGSAVALHGRGYLFVAGCGTGKSTHARLWRETLGAQCVNDDKPFLRLADDGVWLCGSPWRGKHGLGENISVPLAAICCLERGEENAVTPLPADPSLLLPYITDPDSAPLLTRLVGQIPLWRLQCTPTASAALACYEAVK